MLATVFDVCFLAPVYGVLALLAIGGSIVGLVWVASVIEERMKKPAKPKDPAALTRLYCAKCGELIHLNEGALALAKSTGVKIRCSCGAIVEAKT